MQAMPQLIYNPLILNPPMKYPNQVTSAEASVVQGKIRLPLGRIISTPTVRHIQSASVPQFQHHAQHFGPSTWLGQLRARDISEVPASDNYNQVVGASAMCTSSLSSRESSASILGTRS